ncbi:hypothetical protein Bca4012_081983 [Brassica carinata]
MKGNKKVAKNKGVPNERRRLSLRPRTTPIAKTPVIPEGSKKSKKSTQEREPSYVSLSVTDEFEREGYKSERSKKSTPVREPSYQSRSILDESEREGSESEMSGDEEKVEESEAEEDEEKLRCKEKTEMYGKPRKGSCKKATPTAGPKKRGRPRTRAVDAAPTITGKRKSEPSHWVQTPFTAGKKAGKKPKTKA